MPYMTVDVTQHIDTCDKPKIIRLKEIGKSLYIFNTKGGEGVIYKETIILIIASGRVIIHFKFM